MPVDAAAEAAPAPAGHNGAPEETVDGLKEKIDRLEEIVAQMGEQVQDAQDSVVAVQHRNRKLEEDSTSYLKAQVRIGRENEQLKAQVAERDKQITLLQSRDKGDPKAGVSAVALTAGADLPPPPAATERQPNRRERRAEAA